MVKKSIDQSNQTINETDEKFLEKNVLRLKRCEIFLNEENKKVKSYEWQEKFNHLV